MSLAYAHRLLDEHRKAEAIAKAAREAQIAAAKADYQAVQLKRCKEAASAKEHLFNLCHPLQLRPESEWHPVTLDEPQVFYKIVAAKHGKLLSVYDGHTQYQLHKWTKAKHGAASWPPVYACFFAHPDIHQALSTKFPTHAVLQKAAKVLIKVEAKGCVYHHAGTGAWALSQVRPIDLLAQPVEEDALSIHYAINPVTPSTFPDNLQEAAQSLRSSRQGHPGQWHQQQLPEGVSPRVGRQRAASAGCTRRPSSARAFGQPGNIFHANPWNPAVTADGLVASRHTDKNRAPSPRKPPFVVPSCPSPKRVRDSSPQQGYGGYAAGAGYRSSAGSPLRTRSAGTQPPVAPSWYIHSAQDKGAAFAANFHYDRPLNERVNVDRGVDDLYREAAQFIESKLNQA